ncbi:DUF2303 family protein [Roseomonas chloroacetimidivorans]|uniref:DUF2303 family protein n=1 Tax=Roseomonas chloroacetimidivorans TaxID=1766656 RepID=UPI003C7209BF
MPNDNDMQAVIDAARQGCMHIALGDNLVFLPGANNGEGRIVNLEQYGAAPARKRGTITVFDAASFNQVLKDNEGAGDVAIYLDRDPTKPTVEAVLNGHGKAGAGWGDLRVKIEFRPTPQWVKWKGIDGKLLPQTDFAEFVEDNLSDIADPAGATMLEIATQFQATRVTAFRRAVRLSDGNLQFENVENTEAKVGATQIQVPETIKLQLAPLQGSPAYLVPARFRYRLEDGKLRLGVKLERVEDLMDRVLGDIINGIERGTNVSVLEGRAPEMARAIG